MLVLGFAVYAVARADVLEDELDEYTERATIEERERIARELHDVVAHRLSTIAVQAGAGLHVLHEDPDRARGAFEAIDETARSGLSEMRQALGLLRAQDAGAALAPQPSLRDVEHLAQESRDAGVPVDADRHRRPGDPPGGPGPQRLPDRPGGPHERPQARRADGAAYVLSPMAARRVEVTAATTARARRRTRGAGTGSRACASGRRSSAARSTPARRRAAGTSCARAFRSERDRGVTIRVAIVDDQELVRAGSA